MSKYTRSFITGSWVYGSPRMDGDICNECNGHMQGSSSDVDLVVLVSEDDLDTLKQECDDVLEGEYKNSASLIFGKLNLVCVTRDSNFEEWKQGTKLLKQLAHLRGCGITRAEAVVLFERLRDPILNGSVNSLQFIKAVVKQTMAQRSHLKEICSGATEWHQGSLF